MVELLRGAVSCTWQKAAEHEVTRELVYSSLGLQVWDCNTLECKATLTGHGGAVRALVASSDKVFSGSDDTTIKVRGPAGVGSAGRPLC